VKHPTHSRLNSQIYREACEWFIECRAGDLNTAARRELDGWLRKSPEHLGAYLEIAALWSKGPLLDRGNKWSVQRLIEQASAGRDNIVQLDDAAPPNDSEPHRYRPDCERATLQRARPQSWFGRAGGLALAATVFVCVVCGCLLWLQTLRYPTYSTDIGEQRSISLVDGSTVDLNSQSRIRVRYSEAERAVDLLEGEALFHVAKDRTRPFTVRSNTAQVRAVGTQFDVYRKRSETVISVVQGRVAVPNPAARPAGRDIYLGAGEQLRVTHDATNKPEHPNIANATAWRQRQLVFESASLAEVAEEFNRYNARRLVIENPEVYTFHISGIFSSTDPSSLVRFLRQRPGVLVSETPGEIRVKGGGAPQKIVRRVGNQSMWNRSSCA
jgi:transmembrane sensor